MKVLTGDKDCDLEIKDELERAGIDIVNIPQDENPGQVPATIKGELGKYKFKRYWCYWVVDGPVPIEIADKLYKHPEGDLSVRVGGYSGGIDPRDFGPQWIDDKGNYLHSKEGRNNWDMYHLTEQELSGRQGIRFVDNPEEEGRSVIGEYHIDSQAGLLLFALAVTGQLNW